QIKAFDVTPSGVWRDGDQDPADGVTPEIVLGDGQSQGTGDGQLNYPYNVDFSLDGNVVYVSDTGNNRVARWDVSDPQVPVWLPPIGGNCVESPNPCPDPPADFGSIDTLRRVIVDPAGRLVTADFWGNGLAVWKSSDIGNGTTDAMLLQIELDGAPLPGFAQAFGVATGPDGEVYVMDRLNQRLEYFDPSGMFQAWGGGRGTSQGRFSWPEAVAVGSDGTVWAADTRGDNIQRWPEGLTSRSNFRRGTSGDGVGEFNYIEDLDVGDDGRVFIADTRNDRVQIYDPVGDGFSVFPAVTAMAGPQGVAATDGGIVVADTGNDRILRFSSSGEETARFTTGLAGPEGIAVDPGDGTIWVADTGNDRILHLSPDLKNLGHTFGASGSGNRQFDLPHSLDVSGDALFVADTFNDRVQVFDISSLGGGTGDVFDPAFSFHVAERGGVAPLYPAGGIRGKKGVRYVADSGGSRIVAIDRRGSQRTISPEQDGWNDPRDLEIDVSDDKRLWVADTSDSQIVKMSAAGAVMAEFGGPSVFQTPYGLANDATGVYVADTYQNRIVKIDKALGEIQWAQGTCDGEAFARPRDVAVGSNGDLYVADTDNDRIVRLDPSGDCVSSFGTSGSAAGELDAPRSLTSDGDGGLWVTEGGSDRLQHFRGSGAFIVGSDVGGVGSSKGRFRSAHCVFLDGRFVDVCDTFNFRIQRFRVKGNGVPVFDSVLGGKAPTKGGFNGAFDVAYGPNGSLFATDWFNHRIQRFNAQGDLVWSKGRYGTADGSFIFPRGIVVDGNTLVVVDSENNRLDLLATSDGSFQGSLKPLGTTFARPHQAAIASGGDYWIADTGNDRVLRVSPNRTVQQDSTTWAQGAQIVSPRGIAVDDDGNVYITTGSKVLKFSPTGSLLATLATAGSGSTQVTTPYGLRVVDTDDGPLLLVADRGNARVLVLTLDGDPVDSFGVAGKKKGQLHQPQGVAMNPVNGDVAVADFGNDRVSIWST
ncbi:MAG TPA: SBBP repeat-containing protein, partial [Actinomycetota bacterium]